MLTLRFAKPALKALLKMPAGVAKRMRVELDAIAADPVRPLRVAALSQLRRATGPARGVLQVIHGHGGGSSRASQSGKARAVALASD